MFSKKIVIGICVSKEAVRSYPHFTPDLRKITNNSIEMCHRHHRQSSKCPTSPCCPDFECAHMKGRRESFCISKSNSLEKVQQKPRMSKKKNELTTENCAPQPPNNCSPYGCMIPFFLFLLQCQN